MANTKPTLIDGLHKRRLAFHGHLVRTCGITCLDAYRDSIYILYTEMKLMLSNCGVIEDYLGCHGWRGKRTNGCWSRLGLF